MSQQSQAKAFEDALKEFERQVAEATQFWFAATAINEVAKQDARAEEALNVTPLFWMTVRGGLEHQAIVAVGRIFGKAKGEPIYIDAVLRLVYDNRTTVFSKAAFAARKSIGSDTSAPWFKDLVDSVHEPTSTDFKRLSRLIKKHKATYENQFDEIRNRYVAHADTHMTPPQLWAIFQKTKIRDMERLLAFLNQLYKVFWQMVLQRSPPRSGAVAVVRSKFGEQAG